MAVKSHIVLAKDSCWAAHNHLYVVLALGDLMPSSTSYRYLKSRVLMHSHRHTQIFHLKNEINIF